MRAAAPAAPDMFHHRESRGQTTSAQERGKNTSKSRVPAKVEHPTLVIKKILAFTPFRYPGLAKNGTRVGVLCALANSHIKRRGLTQCCHA
jgi:IS5 family transposase